MLVIADNNPIRHIRRPWVNYALIGFCILVFVINPPYQQFGFTPANLTLAGDPGAPAGWDTVLLQSVSYIFLHGDLFHLAGNMVVLWVFGSSIEDSMGHARYPLFFVLCGIAGALAEGVMGADPQVPVVGASGAIAGVMGAYLLLHPRARVMVLVAFRVPVLVPASVFVGLGIALDLVSPWARMRSNASPRPAAAAAAASASGAPAGRYAAMQPTAYSTVTALARLRGLSTSVPRARAVW